MGWASGGKPAKIVLHPFVQQRVHADVFAKLLELLGGGQFAVNQQVGRFGEIAPLGNHLDRITPVAEDAVLAVQKGDRAAGRAGVGIAFVERDAARGAEQLADIDGPIAFGALHKWQFVLFIVDCEFCGIHMFWPKKEMIICYME